MKRKQIITFLAILLFFANSPNCFSHEISTRLPQNSIQNAIRDAVFYITMGNSTGALKTWSHFKEFNPIGSQMGVFSSIVKNSYPLDQSDEKFDSLLKFIGSEINVELQGFGFSTLYDIMSSNNHLDGTNIFPFAYQLKKQINYHSQLQSTSFNESKLQYHEMIKQKLPGNVRVIIFADRFLFRNSLRGGYIYAADQIKDGTRRYVYRWDPGYVVTHSTWELRSGDNGVGRLWRLLNTGRGEYLYAATGSNYIDKNRRIVFTWIPRNEVQEDKWRFVSYGNTVELHTDFHGEGGMFADGEYEDKDKDRGKVFTPELGGSVSGNRWIFEAD